MTQEIRHRRLILGSTSPYRYELLARLGIDFDSMASHVDETPYMNEMPKTLAQRLALAKALAISEHQPDAIVLGSDQVADLDGEPINKPENHIRAFEQLKKMRGRSITFHTAIALTCKQTKLCLQDMAQVTVHFRQLTDIEIERYLLKEMPYDCAGSAKVEGLGISIMRTVQSDDPTALIGLPLIRTCEMLRKAGIQIP
jgi:septum formation protein